MTALTRQDLEHLFEALRRGLVPERGLDTFAVGIEKQRGELAEAGALVSWLCGSGNVAAAAKKAAGVKGDIESRNALDYLRGVLEIVTAAGHRGLVIVIDEAETILRPTAALAGLGRDGR